MGTKATDEKAKARDEWSRRITKALKRESDRGCVLLAGSFLEEALGELLQAALRHDTPELAKVSKGLLKGPLAPFGSFYTKIEGAYALGLIRSDMYKLLHRFREARNLMAHSYDHVDFTHAKIRALRLDERDGVITLEPRKPYPKRPGKNTVTAMRWNVVINASMAVGAMHWAKETLEESGGLLPPQPKR